MGDVMFDEVGPIGGIAVYIIWWRPKSLEKYLRRQGIRGTSYKLLYDDMKEIKKSTMDAWSKPMSLKHHIAPRAAPVFHQMESDGPSEDAITPAFHLEKLKKMVPAFSTSCFGLIDRWKELISPQGSREIDLAAEFQNLAGDVIARTAFGSSYEEGKMIFELQKEQAKLVLEAYNNIYIPGFRFIPTKKNKRRYTIDNEIKATLRDMIRRKEQSMRDGELDNNDLPGLLLQCKEQSNNGMTVDDVIEECKLFYFAGQETTATLLTWTMILLSMHPNWQEKARDEVLRISAKKTLDFEAINHLKIVSMVLNEVLRLYPPVTSLYRHTRRKTNIGGMSIPAEVNFVLPTLFSQCDPKCWGEDVEEFNPARFSEGIAKATKDEIAFFPFGWCPKICLGQNFAMIEAKMALAMILQHFSFQLSPSYTHAPCTLITLQPQHGAPIILHQL
ncbi:cytochrome P450 72A397-like [Fagus crenata]